MALSATGNFHLRRMVFLARAKIILTSLRARPQAAAGAILRPVRAREGRQPAPGVARPSEVNVRFAPKAT